MKASMQLLIIVAFILVIFLCDASNLGDSVAGPVLFFLIMFVIIAAIYGVTAKNKNESSNSQNNSRSQSANIRTGTSRTQPKQSLLNNMLRNEDQERREAIYKNMERERSRTVASQLRATPDASAPAKEAVNTSTNEQPPQKTPANKPSPQKRSLILDCTNTSDLYTALLQTDPKTLQDNIRKADRETLKDFVGTLNGEVKKAAGEKRQVLEVVHRFASDALSRSKAADHSPKALDAFRALPEIWVIVAEGLSKPWPAIDPQGFIHVFIREEEASAYAPEKHLKLQKMTGEGLVEKLTEWGKIGIPRVCLHQDGAPVKYQKEDLELTEGFNAGLQAMMIRFLQARLGEGDDYNTTAAIYWSFLRQMIPNTLFIVPFAFAGENINMPVDDNVLRLFPHAGQIILKQRENGTILLFEGYPFAEKADGRLMHFRTLKNSESGEEVLPAYTDFHEILPVWKGRAHFALATFDDMKSHFKPSKGIAINPSSQFLLLDDDSVKQIETLRNSQP